MTDSLGDSGENGADTAMDAYDRLRRKRHEGMYARLTSWGRAARLIAVRSGVPGEDAGSEAVPGNCNETDGFSVCTEPPGHGPVHWDRRTQHEWHQEES